MLRNLYGRLPVASRRVAGFAVKLTGIQYINNEAGPVATESEKVEMEHTIPGL